MTEDKKYTEKELIEFANYILDHYDANPDGVNHASLENWKESKQIIIPRENCNLIIDSDTVKEVQEKLDKLKSEDEGKLTERQQFAFNLTKSSITKSISQRLRDIANEIEKGDIEPYIKIDNEKELLLFTIEVSQEYCSHCLRIPTIKDEQIDS